MTAIEFQELLDDFVKKSRDMGMAIGGCSETEILALEEKYGALPTCYRIFLSTIGSEVADFKVGTAISFDKLDDINEATIELMKENDVSPPENMFAFLLHQGYSALYFTDRHSDDPDVFCYTEGEAIRNIECTFSEYIALEMVRCEEYRSMKHL